MTKDHKIQAVLRVALLVALAACTPKRHTRNVPVAYGRSIKAANVVQLIKAGEPYPIASIERQTGLHVWLQAQHQGTLHCFVNLQNGKLGFLPCHAIAITTEVAFSKEPDLYYFTYRDETQSTEITISFSGEHVIPTEMLQLQTWNPTHPDFFQHFNLNDTCRQQYSRVECNPLAYGDDAHLKYCDIAVGLLTQEWQRLSQISATGELSRTKNMALELLASQIRYFEFLKKYIAHEDLNAYFVSFPNADKLAVRRQLSAAYLDGNAVRRKGRIYDILYNNALPSHVSANAHEYRHNWFTFLKDIKATVTERCIANCGG